MGGRVTFVTLGGAGLTHEGFSTPGAFGVLAERPREARWRSTEAMVAAVMVSIRRPINGRGSALAAESKELNFGFARVRRWAMRGGTMGIISLMKDAMAYLPVFGACAVPKMWATGVAIRRGAKGCSFRSSTPAGGFYPASRAGAVDRVVVSGGVRVGCPGLGAPGECCEHPAFGGWVCAGLPHQA